MDLEVNESELGHPEGWRQEWDVVVYLLGQVGSRQAEVEIPDCAMLKSTAVGLDTGKSAG